MKILTKLITLFVMLIYQNSIAQTIETFTVNGVEFDMVKVEHGSFQMGATPEQGSYVEKIEKPVHTVILTNDFYIGRFEVTQKLWKAVMGNDNNPSTFKGNNRHRCRLPILKFVNDSSNYNDRKLKFMFVENLTNINGDELPVNNVSWNDAQEFITKLNNLTGKKFRLPTEAEWEFSARGGNKSKGYRYSGGNSITKIAWYDYNSRYHPHPVGQKNPNELGIYDMSGNISEWCEDTWNFYSDSTQTNPINKNGNFNIFRGNSWHESSDYIHISYRYYFKPDEHYDFLGFRLAL
ncbi:MAG: formylglycine-generating enzyme family protein [Bacteroidales bacterium]|nr:formylglycine-generating enzyme family protein [Bacteroidales bacterium]